VARHGGQSTLLWKTSHDHHVVNRLSVELHVGNPQVHVRRKSTVENYFVLAIFVSRFPVPEIDEPELKLLSQLVHPVIDEEQY
jgi:hypothetical protein